MTHFIDALQFLTIFTLKSKIPYKKENFGKSLLFFPIVGALLGVIVCVVITAGFYFLPCFVAAAIAVAVSVICTGGLHLDGLADTCDGFYAGRDKESVLRIMRDSHIGAMGVTGIVLVLLFKFSLILSIDRVMLCKALVMSFAFSRWSIAAACFLSKYSRNEGKAGAFIQYANKKTFFGGLVFILSLFFILMQLKGLIIFLLSALVAFLFVSLCKRKISGMTGDTLGALNEITEITVLLFIAII